MVQSAVAADAVTSLPLTAATVVVWRTRGQLYVTVIAKATFASVPDADMSRVEPQPILRAEVHHGDDPGRSVRFSSDLAPYVGRADVLFTGYAYAPPPAPAQSMTVRMALFDGQRAILDKAIRVQDKSGFTQMPLVYERATSGLDAQDNPLGVEPGAGEPNLVDPRDPRRPVGFGPIPRAFPARKRLLGATPRKDLEAPIAEIPEGFDWSYFQTAPLDQRIDFLRGDEWVVLAGLHPTLPLLRTRLPGARGRVRVYGLSAFGMSEGHPLELAADTLRLDGEEQRCTVVWRQSFQVASEAALPALRVVAGVELAGAPISWPEGEHLDNVLTLNLGSQPPAAPEAKAPSLLGTLTLSPEQEAALHQRPATPFPAERAEPTPPPLLSAMAPLPVAPPALRWGDDAPAALPPPPPPRIEPEAPSAPKAPSAPPEERAEPSAVLDLLWFEPKSMPRVRKQPAWRPILDALREKPLDSDIDDAALFEDPAAAEEQREIFEVLAHAEPSNEAALRAAMKAAVRDDGRFVAPLVLLEGELAFCFDEIEALKALSAAVGPLAGSDDRLKAALAAAGDYLKLQNPLSPKSLAEGISAGLKEAYARGKRALPLADLEAQAERALLEQRRYQRRALFGGRHLRCLLRLGGDTAPIPSYLPEALAEALPMFQRFSARLVVEAHLSADQHETHSLSLRVVAAARKAAPTYHW